MRFLQDTSSFIALECTKQIGLNYWLQLILGLYYKFVYERKHAVCKEMKIRVPIVSCWGKAQLECQPTPVSIIP